jgi:hypothetical protein
LWTHACDLGSDHNDKYTHTKTNKTTTPQGRRKGKEKRGRITSKIPASADTILAVRGTRQETKSSAIVWWERGRGKERKKSHNNIR